MKALILSADNFEDSELVVPYNRFKKERIQVEIASMRGGTIEGKHGHQVKVDKTLEEVDSDDYAILILPGGKAPEAIRKEEEAIRIARDFFRKDKPIAAICHGPQLLITAGLVEGKHMTCYRSVAQELKDGGAIHEDKKVVVDGNLITSRQPSDLPAFLQETMKILKKGK